MYTYTIHNTRIGNQNKFCVVFLYFSRSTICPLVLLLRFLAAFFSLLYSVNIGIHFTTKLVCIARHTWQDRKELELRIILYFHTECTHKTTFHQLITKKTPINSIDSMKRTTLFPVFFLSEKKIYNYILINFMFNFVHVLVHVCWSSVRPWRFVYHTITTRYMSYRCYTIANAEILSK